VSLANAQNARGETVNSILANPAIQRLGQAAVNAIGDWITSGDVTFLDNVDLSPEEVLGQIDSLTENGYFGDIDFSGGGYAPSMEEIYEWFI
jgi:hypothetical protein